MSSTQALILLSLIVMVLAPVAFLVGLLYWDQWRERRKVQHKNVRRIWEKKGGKKD